MWRELGGWVSSLPGGRLPEARLISEPLLPFSQGKPPLIVGPSFAGGSWLPSAGAERLRTTAFRRLPHFSLLHACQLRCSRCPGIRLIQIVLVLVGRDPMHARARVQTVTW